MALCSLFYRLFFNTKRYDVSWLSNFEKGQLLNVRLLNCALSYTQVFSN